MKKNSMSVHDMVIKAMSEGFTTVVEMTEYLNRTEEVNRSTVRQAAQKMVFDGELNRFVDDKGVIHYSMNIRQEGKSLVRMMDMLLAPVRGRAF